MTVLIENYLPVVQYNNLNTNKQVNVLAATATIAGGATTPALLIGSSGLGIYFGSGAPTITANQGSIYLNTTGSSTSTRMYVNTTGSTTWTAVTTAA